MKIRDVEKLNDDLKRDLEHLEENLRSKKLFGNNSLNTSDNSYEISELEGRIENKKQELEDVKKVLDVYKELREKIVDVKSIDGELRNVEIDNYLDELNDKINDFSDEYKEAFASSIDDLNNLTFHEIEVDDNVVEADIVQDIDYYRGQLKSNESELERLKKYREGIIKGIQNYPASEEERKLTYSRNMGMNEGLKDVDEEIASLKDKISNNKRIIDTYDSAIKQAENIRWLYRSLFDNKEDEKIINSQIQQRVEVMRNDIDKLPDNLKKDVENYIEKIKEEERIAASKRNPQLKSNETDNVLALPPHEENRKVPTLPSHEDEEEDLSKIIVEPNKVDDPVIPALPPHEESIIGSLEPSEKDDKKSLKVVGKKTWNWVKKNKKKLLIAAGITAVSVSAILLATKFIPIYAATSKMAANSLAWHTASAAGKESLHAANVKLAAEVAKLTGKAELFNSATGVWSFAGNKVAMVTSSAVRKIAAATAVAGLGTGVGLAALNKNGKKIETNEEIEQVQNTNENSVEKEKSSLKDRIRKRLFKNDENDNTVVETLDENDEVVQAELINEDLTKTATIEDRKIEGNVENSFNFDEHKRMTDEEFEEIYKQIKEDLGYETSKRSLK